MSNIPIARSIIEGLLEEFPDGFEAIAVNSDIPSARCVLDIRERLESALSLMKRPRPVQKLHGRSPRITPALKKRIFADYKAAAGAITFQEIAAKYHVNPGRVSDIVREGLGVS